MNEDIEELLRDGMERFTKDVRAPAGLARTAGRLHRRRLAARTAIASGTALVTAAAVAAVVTSIGGTPGPAGPAQPQARTAAYVISRAENALAGTNLVFRGRTASTGQQTSVTWAHGPQNRFEEFTGSGCGHATATGRCTNRGGSEPYLAEGTALIGGKLTGVYVTYYNREYSLSPPWRVPASACSTHSALVMGGPPVPTSHWSAFINATLRCGAAKVTGHVRVNGMVTTKITGSPVKVKLSPRYAKLVGQEWARAEWTLYVNPKTYLPVRIDSSTQTFGGPAPSTRFASVTDVQWLPPSAANVAKTLVTIPPGFRQVSSPADQ
jgi:hypothetical protein